jgi:hypothetical protein
MPSFNMIFHSSHYFRSKNIRYFKIRHLDCSENAATNYSQRSSGSSNQMDHQKKKKHSQKFSNFLMGDTKEQKKFSIKSFGSEPELRPFLIAVLKLLVRFYFIFVLASHR